MDRGITGGLSEHNANEGDTVQVGEGMGQALVIPDKTTEAGGPGEGTLGHPAPGQEHEAPLGLGSLTTSSSIPCPRAAAAGFSPV